MELLAQEHGFRWAEKSKRYVGIHHGVIVSVSEWDGMISFLFHSPTAQLEEQIQADFSGFSHIAAAGIQASWIGLANELGAGGKASFSQSSCSLTLESGRLESIGVVVFRQIPDLFAADFQAHGASPSLTCSDCDQKEATTVGLVDYGLTPLCEDCWQNIQGQTSGGRLATEQSVNWRFALPALVVLTALGGLIWGYIQQPNHRMSYKALLLPAIWAYLYCLFMDKRCGGVTRTLRVSLFASVILSVLIGNTWGYRSIVIQEAERELERQVVGPGWVESVQLYLTDLPHIWQSEIPFLFGGVLGAWIGLRHLKARETVDVQ